MRARRTRHTVAACAALLFLPSLAPRTAGAQGGGGTQEFEDTFKMPDPVKLTIDFASIHAATEAEAEGDIEGAVAILDNAIERTPDDGTLITARGALHLARGALEAAKRDFDRAVAANSDDPSGFAGRCVMAVIEGEGMGVQDACTAARNRNIEDPVYAEIMMTSHMLEGRLSTVVGSTLDTLVVANPYVPALRLLSLEANLQGEKPALARDDLRLLWQVYDPPGQIPPRIIDRIAAFKLADIVGADIPCYLALAEVQVDRMEGKTPASARVQQAMVCQPEDETLRGERVEQLNRDAMAARGNGDHVQAIFLFQEALTMQPDDPVLLNNLAHTAFEGGDPASAEVALRTLLTLTPDDPELRKNYGICLMALGREDEARPYLEGVEGGP